MVVVVAVVVLVGVLLLLVVLVLVLLLLLLLLLLLVLLPLPLRCFGCCCAPVVVVLVVVVAAAFDAFTVFVGEAVSVAFAVAVAVAVAAAIAAAAALRFSVCCCCGCCCCRRFCFRFRCCCDDGKAVLSAVDTPSFVVFLVWSVVHRCSASSVFHLLCFCISTAGDARQLSAARPCCLQPWSRRLCSGRNAVLCIGSSCNAKRSCIFGSQPPQATNLQRRLSRCCASGALLRRTVVPCPRTGSTNAALQH